MAGSKVCETVVKGVQKVHEKAKVVVESVLSKAVDTAASVVSSVFDFCSRIFCPDFLTQS